MTDPVDDLEQRVTALEQEVSRLRSGVTQARGDSAASRVLATGADRDVAEVRQELRAHTRLLSALRETQVEHGDRLLRLEERLDRVETRLDRVEMRLDSLEAEMRRGFATMSAGMAQIVELLEQRG